MEALIAELRTEIEVYTELIARLRAEIGKVIVGQHYLVDRLLLALIGDGHILVEGIPGLAKTTAIKTLSQAMQAECARIQFTPDLLPSDLLGTEVYRPQDHQFTLKKGPIFTHLLLADEINRAPAKVQSALLEAMQERQVTLAGSSHPLPDPFLVLATQNPIEQEGTYPLPEAQMDRFMLKLRVGYPNKTQEKDILRRMSARHQPEVVPVLTPQRVRDLRELAGRVYLDAKLEDYIVDIVFATREPAAYRLDSLEGLIEYGASPRATIFLARAARVAAFLTGRAFVTPQDVKNVGPDVLRHRVLLSYEAEARGLRSDDLIQEIFNAVDVP